MVTKIDLSGFVIEVDNGSKLRDGSNGHFEVVHHCNKCVPHLPTVIHPLFKALDGKVYRANIINVLPFEIEGKFIIE